MPSTSTHLRSHDSVNLARYIGYGCVTEWFNYRLKPLCFEWNLSRSDSIEPWRARWHAEFTERYRSRDDFIQLLVAFQEGFDSKLLEYQQGRNTNSSEDFKQALAAWHQLDTAVMHQPPTLVPNTVHKSFSWLNDPLTHDKGAQFVALTIDVCHGIQTCLELVHSSDLQRAQNVEEIPVLLDLSDTERLLRFAKVAARLLAEVAEERIDWLNKYGIKEPK